MASTEIFKTVFKGYNKEEVIAYIDDLNQRLSALQKDLEDSNARLLQFEEEYNSNKVEAVDEIALREAIIAELTPVLREQMRAEIAEEVTGRVEQETRKKLEVELAAKYEEIARTEIAHRVQSQTADFEELRHKAQMYDDNREVLAELMIKAKNDAADIIHDAEERACMLREEAEQRFKLLISDYELLKKNLLTSKQEALRYLDEVYKGLDSFEKRFLCMDQDVALSKAHIEDE